MKSFIKSKFDKFWELTDNLDSSEVRKAFQESLPNFPPCELSKLSWQLSKFTDSPVHQVFYESSEHLSIEFLVNFRTLIESLMNVRRVNW